MSKYIKVPILTLSIFISLTFTNVSRSSELSEEKITLTDLYQLKEISAIDVSHSAEQIAYSVSSVDEKKDRYRNDIWLLDINKNKEKILLKGNPWVGKTKFSPDDTLLGYLAPGRGRYSEYQQIWTINTKYSLKRQLTKLNTHISDFEWSPDGTQMIFVAESRVIDKETDIQTPKPIVIDRYYFKEDGKEFLGDEREHLHLLDIKTKTTKQLTKGTSNEILPSWSPDGKKVAYVTKTGEMDRTDNYDVYVLEIDSTNNPIQLTTNLGSDSSSSRPQWSPDGKKIAYLHGGDPALLWYALQELAVIDLDTKTNSILTKELDRNASSPQWSDDGQNIYFVIEDNMKSQLAKYSLKEKKIEKIIPPNYYIAEWAKNYVVRNGKIGLILSNTNSPEEVFFYDENNLIQQSNHNSELLSSRQILKTETISFTAADGEELFGMMIKPDNFDPSKQYPLIIRMHGGPVSQYGLYFNYDWQLFAAKVYVSMENKLLFKSGSWAVNSQGRNAIVQLGNVLAENPDIAVLIEGHTDNVPFSNRGQISNNWDLSTKRATAIISILAENKAISLENLTAAGRSKYSPVDSNDSNKGKAKNRRIEVVLTPKLDEISKLLNKN